MYIDHVPVLLQAHPSQPYLGHGRGLRNGHCVTPNMGMLGARLWQTHGQQAGHNIEVLVTPQVQSFYPSVKAGHATDVTRAAW